MKKKYLNESIKLGNQDLIVETGKVAKQADGSVVIRYGDTMLLVAAVSARTAREGLDFFPLTVEYREHNYAAGRIPALSQLLGMAIPPPPHAATSTALLPFKSFGTISLSLGGKSRRRFIASTAPGSACHETASTPSMSRDGE